MVLGNDRWARVLAENAVTAEAAASTHVSFVLNEPSEGLAGADYEWDSIIAEYLDNAEVSELVTAARDAGFSVKTYDGERAFIAAVSSGEWAKIPFKYKYVFNTTGSGTGRARTSLVPAFCDLHGIRLCSADGLTAAMLESKVTTFRLLAALGFPTPRAWVFRSDGWDGDAPTVGTKIICKPAHECSSIGIDAKSIFDFEATRTAFIAEMARVYRQPILVQEFVEGYEVEVPVFACPEPVSPAAIGITVDGSQFLGESILDNRMVVEGAYGFYDFDARDGVLSTELRETATRVYARLGFTGLVRVDYRITKGDAFFITDVSTPPHLTDHSSCRFAFTNSGLHHSDLLLSLVTAGRTQAPRQ